MRVELSNCCNAPVTLVWTRPFDIKISYECTKCLELCDIGGKSFKEEDV